VRVATGIPPLGKNFSCPAGGRANTKQADGFDERVVELVRCVGRYVDGVAGTREGLFTRNVASISPSSKNEGLFKIMPVRWRDAARRNVHVDDGEAIGSLLARNGYGVGIADKADVGQCLIGVRTCERECSLQVIGRKRRVLRGGLGHRDSPF